MRTDRRWLHLFLIDESSNAKRIPVGLCICFDPTTAYYIPLSPPLPSWPSAWERVDISMRVSRSMYSQCSAPTPKSARISRHNSEHGITYTESRRGNIYGTKWDQSMISLVLRFSSFPFEIRALDRRGGGRGSNECSGLCCVSRHFAFCYIVARNARHRVKTKSLWDAIVQVGIIHLRKMHLHVRISTHIHLCSPIHVIVMVHPPIFLNKPLTMALTAPNIHFFY